MNLDEKMDKFARYIDRSENIVFLGGAGVSTESGIPDFRSASGIYNINKNRVDKTEEEYDVPPEVMLSRTYFFAHTDKFYDFYKSKMLYLDAKPNDAHKVLAKLEKKGKLKAVVTQNIDNLHQEAGSKNVIELHGTVKNNFCIKCRKKFDVDYIVRSTGIPYCDNYNCGGIIKPDVVLYEEQLNQNSVKSAINYITNADMLIIGGTSLAVYPAASFVNYFYFESKHNRNNKTDKRDKAKKFSVIINKSETAFDDMFDISIKEDGIGSIMRKLYVMLYGDL